MQLESASLNEQGGRARNEDALGEWSGERLYYCVLADGAGGHGAGDVAARIVIDTTLADLRFLTVTELPPDGERLRRALLHAHANIVEEQARGGELADMCSTGLVLAIDRERQTAAWAHSGDTRLYWFRGGGIDARTRDHSLAQELMDASLLPFDDARQAPHRNVLVASLGTRDGARIDCVDGTRGVRPRDAVLLCTDGLWTYVDDAFMLEALRDSVSPAQWIARMSERVRASAPARHDNYSALAVWIGAAT
ncbi:serine/threonine phosphatase [Burkholderia sp. THE68]|uniref:PP2C family protein-serine/threonine phosphatase n=1 Tax=Burkholderia sp. THE68 TaxID=758782 RepID=UPI001317233F|nr:protein phosphatase 2C domain-containing protein [Burkholderia sp. THE68]BBU31937.1 serine/threonine phosphatase [Burkholderia sp. THE68]